MLGEAARACGMTRLAFVAKVVTRESAILADDEPTAHDTQGLSQKPFTNRSHHNGE
jgi:hypothetical protein